MRIRALQPAKTDLDQAAAHLERERFGAGERLLAAYFAVGENLERFPQMYSLVDDDFPGYEVRNAIIERFHYRVIYLVRPDELVILAVAHTSRRPGHWHGRLDEETLS